MHARHILEEDSKVRHRLRWTMKTLVSRNLPGFLYTLCITGAFLGTSLPPSLPLLLLCFGNLGRLSATLGLRACKYTLLLVRMCSKIMCAHKRDTPCARVMFAQIPARMCVCVCARAHACMPVRGTRTHSFMWTCDTKPCTHVCVDEACVYVCVHMPCMRS